MIHRSERSEAAQSDTTRRFLRPISSWTNLKSGLTSSSKKSHCDLSITPFPPIDEDVATDFSGYRRSTIHTPFSITSNTDMIAIETMQPQVNGMDGMKDVVHIQQEAEIMQGSTDSSSVGIAFTTNEDATPKNEVNDAFNQQYREQQLAYQRAMQEQQEEKERQAAAARVIKTIEKSEDEQQSQLPSQNRVFGLRKDLAGPSTELVNYEHNQQTYTHGLDVQDFSSTSQSSPATSAPPLRPVDSESPTADIVPPPSDGPKFSVEVIAPAFDKRGYPVFAGRGARIRGFLRTEALDGHEIVVKLTAAISQGSPAAMWNGVALMPPEQGTERRVFTVEDRIPLNEEMSSLKPGADPSSTNRHDYIYSVPFDLNLPLGVATRWVNGEQKTTAVALPPSYEMSSENDASRREWNRSNGLMKSSGASIKSRSSRMTSFSQNLGTTVKDAVKDGVGEVYRIGCFYKMIFSLQKLAKESEAEPVKRKLGRKKKPKEEVPKVLDSISVPFIFLGEPTSLPPPPHSIPLPLVPPVLMDSSMNLGDQWDCERNQAKWSGNFFRVAKRLVDLELHMPSPAVLQAPSVFPFILVIRPSDPNLLSTIPSIAAYQEEGLDVNPNRLSSPSPRPGNSRAGRPEGEMAEDNGDQTPTAEFDGILSRFKSSMSLNRKLSQGRLRGKMSTSTLGGGTTVDGHGGSGGGGGQHHDAESTVGGSSQKSTVIGARRNYRRPNTAPSMNGSSEGGGGTTVFGAGGRYHGALSGLVRVSLIQSTYCVASGPSEVPKSRRRLISEAEVEEVDFETIAEEDGRMYGQASEATLAAIQDAQMKGIRVLRGTFRVGTDATPSFRCQGIEVKYAIKVDLVPFAKKDKRKGGDDPSSGGTIGSNRSSLNIPSSSASLHSSSSPPMPPVPLQHRQAVTTQQQNNIRASMGTSSGISLSGQTQGGGGYAASTAGGTSRYGGGSTIVSESAMTTRLDKGIGALWADVRMVRSAFAN